MTGTSQGLRTSKRREDIIPVLLAGGEGSRLFPVSTPDNPKPFLPAEKNLNFLQLTASRVAGFSGHIVVCQDAHEDAVKASYSEIGMTPGRIILEPCRKNTAPAVCAAACLSEPDDILLVLPTDHVMNETGAFITAIERAAAHARQGRIVLFGIAPDGPETRYGYIQPGVNQADGSFTAQRFLEKPDAAKAEQLLRRGCYWNSGMIMFRASVMLKAFEAYQPEMLGLVLSAIRDGQAAPACHFLEAGSFRQIIARPVDVAILENAAENCVVFPLDCFWMDVGTLEAYQANVRSGL